MTFGEELAAIQQSVDVTSFAAALAFLALPDVTCLWEVAQNADFDLVVLQITSENVDEQTRRLRLRTYINSGTIVAIFLTHQECKVPTKVACEIDPNLPIRFVVLHPLGFIQFTAKEST